MPIQKLPSSTPPNLQERFFIKRIDEEDIEISLEERNAILESLNKGVRFVQIGKFTLMLNAIKSIDPKWGAKNIPPIPKEEYGEGKLVDGVMQQKLINKKEIDLWYELFANEDQKRDKKLFIT